MVLLVQSVPVLPVVLAVLMILEILLSQMVQQVLEVRYLHYYHVVLVVQAVQPHLEETNSKLCCFLGLPYYRCKSKQAKLSNIKEDVIECSQQAETATPAQVILCHVSNSQYAYCPLGENIIVHAIMRYKI